MGRIIIIQEILVNHGQSNGMTNVCSKYHTVRVKCVGPPNAAGAHLPPLQVSVKDEVLTDLMKKKRPIE